MIRKSLTIFSLISIIGWSVLSSAQSTGSCPPDGCPTGGAIASTIEVTTATPEKPILTIYEKLKMGHYREGVAALLTLLMFFWRTYGNNFLLHRIPNKFLPLITGGLGIVSRLPILLTSNSFSWDWFIIEGFLVSAEAMAFWSVVGKFTLPKVFKGKDNGNSEAVS